MAISDVKMTMSMDNTKVLSGLKQAQGAVQDFGQSVSKEMTAKLKMALSMTAIEEATRRTGKWAQEIDQTSKSMGIANETLQLLQLLASKTGTPKDAVVGMFESIGKARDQAIAGNQDMINAFARLGVTMQDLRTKSKDVFVGMAADKIKALASANNGIEKAGQQARGAVAAVTGNTPEAFIDAIVGAIKEGFESTKTEAVSAGDIIPEQDVSNMSATFSEIGQNFKDIMTDLTPVFAVLLSLFNTLVLALGGIVGAIKDIWNIVTGVLTGDFSKAMDGVKDIGGLLANAAFGIVKGVASLFDLILGAALNLRAAIFGKLPIIGKRFEEEAKKFKEMGGTAEAVGDWQKKMNKGAGFSEKTAKRGAALGEVAAIVATGGEAGVGVAMEEGASVVAGAAAKAGLKRIATKAKAFETTAGKIASGKRGLFGERTIANKIRWGQFEKGLKDWESTIGETTSRQVSEEEMASRTGEDSSVLGGQPTVRVALEGEVPPNIEAYKHAANYHIRTAGEAGLRARKILMAGRTTLGIGGAGGLAGAKTTGGVVGTPSPDVTPILPMTGMLEGTKAGGGSMLSMGGLFGSNFQSKMIKLNERMVSLLANIATNTQASRGSEFNSAGGASNIGGMAGGI